MTGDRRLHSREPIDKDAGEASGDRRQRLREPADTHFRHLNDRRARPAAPPDDDAGSE